MDACLREGVRKLVLPATWPFVGPPSLPASALLESVCSMATGGTGAGGNESFPPAGRRNETLDNIRDLGFSLSCTTWSSDALSFPLPSLGGRTPDSSRGVPILALDFVAVRKLCSNDERNRLNVFGCASETGRP